MAQTIKLQYAAPVDLTITNLGALASNTNLLVGWNSAYVDNSSNQYVDYQISGYVLTTASASSQTSIMFYLYAQTSDTPTWPGAITGAEASGITFATNDDKNNALKGWGQIVLSAGGAATYPIPFCGSVAALFGGNVPRRWGIFVTQNTTQNLGAAGSMKIQHTPMYLQSTP